MTGLIRFGGMMSVLLWMAGPVVAQPQPAAPNLTRTERTLLQSVVAAVDRGTPIPAMEVEWPIHVLRASDGSHYVAFSILAPPGLAAKQAVALYVRLATSRDERTTVASERSAVAEWLAGHRSTPLPPERGIAFGEMPIYGPGAIASRPQPSQSLRLLEMERERARERREERDRQRKAALEGEAERSARPLLPFEDFDLNAVAAVTSGGVPVLRRSLTAGPGDYVLTVAWADPKAKDLGVKVVSRRLKLPIASTTEFALSSIVVAERVSLREASLRAEEQSGNPYSIGPLQIVPADDTTLTNDERLALVVQVINPRAAPDGKPDVAVGFQVFRTSAAGQQNVGMLNPQIYNSTTLPPDFNVLKGHPIFAAVEIPLRNFKRGDYRIQVVADDRIGSVNARADATFTIAATPANLLRDAPTLAQPFRRDDALTATAITAVVAGLRPPQPSTALAGALDAARDRRFVDLLREDAIRPEDLAPRAVLRGLALFALGDAGAAVAIPLRQALQASAADGPVRFLLGATHAAGGNDRDALFEWNAALAAGFDPAALQPLMIDAYFRQGDVPRALELAMAAHKNVVSDVRVMRQLAAAHLAIGQSGEALSVLQQLLTQQPSDVDAQWLLVHTLFATMVKEEDAAKDEARRERFKQAARTYIEAKGRHADIAAEWLKVVP